MKEILKKKRTVRSVKNLQKMNINFFFVINDIKRIPNVLYEKFLFIQ